MARVVVASYNVENLFARPKAFNTAGWAGGKPILTAYQKVNELIQEPTYDTARKRRIRDLLVELGIYYVNAHGAVRRRHAQEPQWAWLRKNRGSFDREPRDPAQSVEITARGRADWVGWVELATEATDEVSTRATARVIADIDADIIAIVEAEDRPSLVRLNKELLGGRYEHVMLVDGNDSRGIDVGIMTKGPFPIESIKSNVDLKVRGTPVFSRDCPQYEVHTPGGGRVHLLVNHFKSQSGGGGPKRKQQAAAVHRIAADLVSRGEHVIVLGDLNEGPRVEGEPAANLADLFADPLVSCFDLPGFDTGGWPGTFDTCTLRNRFDYQLLSTGLTVTGGRLFRKGLWGSRTNRDDKWPVYDEITGPDHQASDHAAVVVELDL